MSTLNRATPHQPLTPLVGPPLSIFLLCLLVQYNPAQGRPLNFFDAFMDNGRAQATYSYPRVRELQQRFGGEEAAGTQLVGGWAQPASCSCCRARWWDSP